MPEIKDGSLRLFRVAGIDVFLHWSWAVVAYFEINARRGNYDLPVWNVAEYLTLFGIVLLHEFGHALACRQVGGQANRIVLWPLGGIAYVAPPPRPGAVLWSIAAGPIVNVVLEPVTIGLCILAELAGCKDTLPDVYHYLQAVLGINTILLIFNLLPIYPLDGGQIVQALLWFIIGRVRSLQVVSILGFLSGAAIVILALFAHDWWIMILALFIAFRSVAGFRYAQALAKLAKAPRHKEFICPSCGASPLAGPFWTCDQCKQAFDTFENGAVCPNCFARFPETACPECHRRHAINEWLRHDEPTDGKS